MSSVYKTVYKEKGRSERVELWTLFDDAYSYISNAKHNYKCMEAKLYEYYQSDRGFGLLDKMIEVPLGWVETDDDCMQQQKRIGESTYQMVEIVWLDTTREDDGYPDKCYIVKSAIIDLDDYEMEEIEGCISSYGYEMETLSEITDDPKSLIAECIFEDMTDCKTYGMMTKEDAETFVREYITRN